MRVPSKLMDMIPVELKQASFDMESIGSQGLAWTYGDAGSVLDIAEAAGFPCLGGSVLHFKDGRFRFNYDNWHCDPGSDEDLSLFCSRSHEVARKYLQSYPLKDEGHLFALALKSR